MIHEIIKASPAIVIVLCFAHAAMEHFAEKKFYITWNDLYERSSE